MSPRRAATAAPIFAALGDETRLGLVNRLGGGGELSIAQLTSGARLSRQAITKHLLTLQRAGLVHGVRRGRERLWMLDPQPLDRARRDLARISAQWDEALERLRRFVEEKE
jgi:DNA-binding transcriptional ArsR family regulator